MNYKESNLAVFEQPEILNRVIWQPRIDHWFNVNKKLGRLPDRFKEKSLFEVYDELGCSPRPYNLFNTVLCIEEGEDIQYIRKESENEIFERWITPIGEICKKIKKTEHGLSSSLVTEFPVKNISDIEIFEYILKNRSFSFDYQEFKKYEEIIGDQTQPIIYLPRVPLQRLFINYIGFEKTIYALQDHPDIIEKFLNTIKDSEDEMFNIVKNSPIQIINFGDNIDVKMNSPRLFEKYILPYYQSRSKELKNAGKYTHAHWDGHVKPFLKYLAKTGLDGIEAITPEPQGDVTLEEIREFLPEDMVLIDGIPAIYFMDTTPIQKLKQMTFKIMNMFAPRIILGISDELPPDADINRVQLVSDWVRNYKL